MLEAWAPVLVALVGSALSGYWGVRIGQARMEERHIALAARVATLEAWKLAKEQADYAWRHDEYSPQISNIWAEVRPMKAIVERLERWIHPK